MKVRLGRFNRGPGPRRINIEIENFDTWSLDNTMALIILPALIQLKHTKHGVPSAFVNDMAESYHDQYVFDFIKEDANEVFEKGCAKWDEVLDKMIWSFQQLVMDDYDSKYHHGETDFSFEKIEEEHVDPVTGKREKYSRLVDNNPGGHWYDMVGHILHEERIQEGLELFGQHFRSLWD